MVSLTRYLPPFITVDCDCDFADETLINDASYVVALVSSVML